MNNIETMKLALEALENNKRTHHYCEDTWYSCPKHEDGCANDAEGDECNCGANKANAEIDTAMKAIRQAIEQAQKAKPVVWMYQDKSTHEMRFQKHMSEFVDHSKTSEVPLYGEPLANHELQCVCGAVWCGDEMVHLPNKTPPRQPEQPKVRTGDCLLVGICASEGHKIQPPRQPLTDREVGAIMEDINAHGKRLYEFARAIEAAVWEKQK